jgi:hypothetical protein
VQGQTISAPSEDDITAIARALIHADELSRDVVGESLDGTEEDLARIQGILDRGSVEREATYSLQALGMAFGKVFVEQTPDYDWWMVEDEYGRDPAIRYKKTSLLTFPRTIISKRIEDGEKVDIVELFYALQRRMAELVAQGYAA